MSPRRASVLALTLAQDVRVLEDIHWVMLGGEVVKERTR